MRFARLYALELAIEEILIENIHDSLVRPTAFAR